MGGKRTVEQRKADWVKYKHKNPDVNKIKHRNRMLRDPEGFRAVKRAWAKANRDKRRESSWKHQGIKFTVSEYEALFNSQGRTCAICQRPEPQHGRLFAVDHDHETGQIRGILCFRCNRVVDAWAGNKELYDRATTYFLR